MNAKEFVNVLSEAQEHTEYLQERLAIQHETESPNFMTLPTCKLRDIFFSFQDLIFLLENSEIKATCNELMLHERKNNNEPF